MLKINDPEFLLMKKFIEEHCGIFLEGGKEYLIESRLSDLAIETGCNSFQEFHYKARTDPTGRLRDRIIDLMTTNETLWFRDASAWEYISEIAVPDIIDKAAAGNEVRIWSAAASTGQEAYSLVMLLDEASKKKGLKSIPDSIEIIGTDISSAALLLAGAARYDTIAMSRGLPEDKKQRYFKQAGNIWMFDEDLKKRVRFIRFNLQNSFTPLGKFDLILCRYVTIYFSEPFKKEIFAKMAVALKSKGVLLLGATESARGFSDDFDISYYKNAAVNTLKGGVP